MPLREDILAPIAGENPSGIDLRYDTKLLIYDKIREARRKDDDLAQGDWQSERKTANYPLVIKLAQDTLATVSKDLQLAAWLTEALLVTEHYGGLCQGITLCHGLLTAFLGHGLSGHRGWRPRAPGQAALLDRLYARLSFALSCRSSAPDIPGSSTRIPRLVGYEDQVKTDKERKTRSEVDRRTVRFRRKIFDKAFAETAESVLSHGGEGPGWLPAGAREPGEVLRRDVLRTMLPPSAN